mmetsp:Transcript_124823/g.347563  ORF Transcript_124823/g.347563 Transcript_124823/m.347563 type:complete len:220 (+) Transcript_124823:619-1278(+)
MLTWSAGCMRRTTQSSCCRRSHQHQCHWSRARACGHLLRRGCWWTTHHSRGSHACSAWSTKARSMSGSTSTGTAASCRHAMPSERCEITSSTTLAFHRSGRPSPTSAAPWKRLQTLPARWMPLAHFSGSGTWVSSAVTRHQLGCQCQCHVERGQPAIVAKTGPSPSVTGTPTPLSCAAPRAWTVARSRQWTPLAAQAASSGRRRSLRGCRPQHRHLSRR